MSWVSRILREGFDFELQGFKAQKGIPKELYTWLCTSRNRQNYGPKQLNPKSLNPEPSNPKL